LRFNNKKLQRKILKGHGKRAALSGGRVIWCYLNSHHLGWGRPACTASCSGSDIRLCQTNAEAYLWKMTRPIGEMDGVEHGGLLIPGFSSQKPYHHYSTLHTKQICVLLITLPKQIPFLNNSTTKRHLISFVCPASTRWGNQSS
jgi:hypothetical protein